MQMLSQREQLMEDIASIIESFRFETYDDLYELEKNLCDAVLKKLSYQMNMNTQPNTYLVRLYDEFTMMQTTRTMPTTPTTSKGLKAQQNRVLKWAEKTYPNQIRYEVQPLKTN